jgi:hypothetical protein
VTRAPADAGGASSGDRPNGNRRRPIPTQTLPMSTSVQGSLPSARVRACDGCAVSTRTARGLSARQSDHAGQPPHHAALGQQQRQLRSEHGSKSPAKASDPRVKCPFFCGIEYVPWNHLIERRRACGCSQALKRVSVAAFAARSWYLVAFSVLGILGVLGIFVVAASLAAARHRSAGRRARAPGWGAQGGAPAVGKEGSAHKPGAGSALIHTASRHDKWIQSSDLCII